MKKLIAFLCVLGALFGAEEKSLTQQGVEAYKKGKYQKAVELFQKACERGNALGCGNLGVMYDKGEGVKQNKFKAVELFTQACEEGKIGCSPLGVMYEYGEGVRQDKRKAKEFYGKACDMKEELGCKNYARLNEAGY